MKRDGISLEFLRVQAAAAVVVHTIYLCPRIEEEEVEVQVFSGDSECFPSVTREVEPKGHWYFPILGSLITSGGHLLLAIAERLDRTKQKQLSFLCTGRVSRLVFTPSGHFDLETQCR